MLTTDPFDDKLREECGIFGIFGAENAAGITALGLHALQHRGQEAAGITSFDGANFHSHRGVGHVARVFREEATVSELAGSTAIGHVRYATTGGTGLRNVQPLFADLASGGFAVAHNGNISNAMKLRARAEPARLDLPIDRRHRGDHPPGRDLELPHPARSLHRRAEAGRGRLQPGLPDAARA